ncbi:MAG: hypothetical protein KJO27_09040 [Gammaproteobacteria bacterium]|nr:hypothetical protein [Gammaproteobacteria bacterium]NNL45557.1 hypothetical protein [Woeseiaceae bacterium]
MSTHKKARQQPGFFVLRSMRSRLMPLLHHATHATHAAHVRHRRSSNLVLRCIGDHCFGRQQQARNRSSVLQRVSCDLGGIENTCIDHVTVLAGCRVVTIVALAFGNGIQNNACVTAGVTNDLPQRLFDRTLEDTNADVLVVIVTLELRDQFDSADQRNTTTWHNALLDSSTGRVQRIFNACFLLFHLDFGRSTNLDDGNTARQLGNTLLQLLFVVVRRGISNLVVDLLDACLDVRCLAGAIDDRRRFFRDLDLLGLAEIAESSSDYDKEKLQERVAKLSGGVAVIKVGAATEVEMKEKKARVEDALHATRAAVEEGVVPGGGVALIRAVKLIAKLKGDNDDQNVGIGILKRAVEEPLRQIVRNAGGDASVVLNAVALGKGNYGYNAATGEYGDMIEQGILDPTKVTRYALQNAASVSGLLLTTEAMVADAPQDEVAGPPMPDMGGMGGMGGMM